LYGKYSPSNPARAAEETEHILNGNLTHGTPKQILKKLERLSLADPESLDSLPRNLRIFYNHS
jgi:hypothetical protein